MIIFAEFEINIEELMLGYLVSTWGLLSGFHES